MCVWWWVETGQWPLDEMASNVDFGKQEVVMQYTQTQIYTRTYFDWPVTTLLNVHIKMVNGNTRLGNFMTFILEALICLSEVGLDYHFLSRVTESWS